MDSAVFCWTDFLWNSGITNDFMRMQVLTIASFKNVVNRLVVLSKSSEAFVLLFYTCVWGVCQQKPSFLLLPGQRVIFTRVLIWLSDLLSSQQDHMSACFCMLCATVAHEGECPSVLSSDHGKIESRRQMRLLNAWMNVHRYIWGKKR